MRISKIISLLFACAGVFGSLLVVSISAYVVLAAYIFFPPPELPSSIPGFGPVTVDVIDGAFVSVIFYLVASLLGLAGCIFSFSQQRISAIMLFSAGVITIALVPFSRVLWGGALTLYSGLLLASFFSFYLASLVLFVEKKPERSLGEMHSQFPAQESDPAQQHRL